MTRSWTCLASFPGHSQILSRSSVEFSPWLRDKIWEWPGNEAKTCLLRTRCGLLIVRATTGGDSNTPHVAFRTGLCTGQTSCQGSLHNRQASRIACSVTHPSLLLNRPRTKKNRMNSLLDGLRPTMPFYGHI